MGGGRTGFVKGCCRVRKTSDVDFNEDLKPDSLFAVTGADHSTRTRGYCVSWLRYGCWFVCDDEIGKDTIRKGDSGFHGRVSVSYGVKTCRKSTPYVKCIRPLYLADELALQLRFAQTETVLLPPRFSNSQHLANKKLPFDCKLSAPDH